MDECMTKRRERQRICGWKEGGTCAVYCSREVFRLEELPAGVLEFLLVEG